MYYGSDVRASMSSPLTKITPGSIETSNESRVFGIEDEDAHAVLEAFSSETTREIYAELCTEPATPSKLANNLDTSLQNLSYHLDKLEASGLITTAGTRYSSRGHEMTVYRPRNDPLVFTGDPDTRTTLEASLPRVLSGLAVVAGVGLLWEWTRRTIDPLGAGSSNVGAAGVDATGTGATSLLALLFEPTVLLLLGAVLMAIIVFLPELR